MLVGKQGATVLGGRRGTGGHLRARVLSWQQVEVGRDGQTGRAGDPRGRFEVLRLGPGASPWRREHFKTQAPVWRIYKLRFSLFLTPTSTRFLWPLGKLSLGGVLSDVQQEMQRFRGKCLHPWARSAVHPLLTATALVKSTFFPPILN